MTRAAPRRRADTQRRGRRVAERVPAYVDPSSPDAVGATPGGADAGRAAEQPAGDRRDARRDARRYAHARPTSRPTPEREASGDETVAPAAAASPASQEHGEAAASASVAPRRTPRMGRLGVVGFVTLWLTALALGLLALAASALDVGPDVVGGIGAVVVSTAYTWALAARTGGRPVIFSALTLAVGAAVLALDQDELRTGAAVLTAAVAAVLGVMLTVPARRFPQVVRETVVAVVIAGIGTFAALGYRPVVDVARFQYAVLACAMVCAFFLVYRLGAGLHGLGRRGMLVVVVGGVMLAVTLLYAELIRRYGTPGLVGSVHDGVVWCRDHLGGYPRPIEALLGIPSLAWGTHMRARRRQGWWVCAFGVGVTAPVASTLLNADIGILESLVSVGYSLVVGLVIGFVVIRVDLAFTGYPSRGDAHRPVGRRAAREAEDASAVRPEPGRARALL